MERGSNAMRRRWSGYTERKKTKPKTPMSAAVTITGFNVKKSHSPQRPVPTKRSALKINSSSNRRGNNSNNNTNQGNRNRNNFIELLRTSTAKNLNRMMTTTKKRAENTASRALKSYANALENAWSLRRIPTNTLRSLVNRVPRTTNMGRATANALRFELNRRNVR